MKLSTFTLSMFAALTSAQVMANDHYIVAKNCWLQATNEQTILATQGKFNFIKLSDQGFEQLMDYKEKIHHSGCGNFFNVTHDWQQSLNKTNPQQFLSSYLPHKNLTANDDHVKYKIQYPNVVTNIFKSFSPETMWADLTTLTAYKDRYADSDDGVAAANWLKQTVEQVAKDTGHTDVTAYFVKTGNENTERYKQPSLVVKMGDSNLPGIVVGGHMDTTSSIFVNKPGADDDGSGSVTVLATARTLLASHQKFKKPIYFIWYAAEEEGLVGSQYVVQDFQKKKIPVDAVIQFDMTGYADKNNPTALWLIKDNVSPDLTNFVEELIKTYIKKPIKYTKCGYACSDHASWHKGGFKAAMPFEASFNTDNPDVHTNRDVMANLSQAHMSDFAQLGVAFAVELAELQL